MADFGIGELAAVASLAGTGVSALGAITSGNAQAAQANYSAQVAANNQITASRNAAYALQAGNQDATNAGLRARAVGGAIAAELAANGMDANSGSAVDVREGQAEKGQLDTETTLHNAQLKAYGYRTQSVNFDAQSQLDKASAGFDQTAGLLKAGGSLLSGASALPAKWAAFSTTDFGGGSDDTPVVPGSGGGQGWR